MEDLVKMAEATIDVDKTEEAFVNNFIIDEKQLQTETEEKKKQNEYAICDMCFSYNFGKVPAKYMCCEKYRCDACFEGHQTHKSIHVESEEIERDRQIDNFIDELMTESRREFRFETLEEFVVEDIVSIKHSHDDKDCNITGICELSNSSWVVSDKCHCGISELNNSSWIVSDKCNCGKCELNKTNWVVSDKCNFCIKIYKSVSNTLQRYIRLMSEPADVTEINIPSEQGETANAESSAVSETTRSEPDKQCILAVTLPLSYRIVFIDLKRKPAVMCKTIETEKQCYSIEFSKGKIFTICRRKYSDPWFLTIMSTDGIVTQTFNTELYDGWTTHLAVSFSERVYITDRRRNKVFLLDKEGKVERYKGIKGSGPEGISIDQDNKRVYVCSFYHDKIYTLDFSLNRFESLDFKAEQWKEPLALCFHRDKLYVGHAPLSAHANFVTVIRV